MPSSYFYAAYGFLLESDQPIPNLIPLDSPVHLPILRIRFDETPSVSGAWITHPHAIDRSGDAYRHLFVLTDSEAQRYTRFIFEDDGATFTVDVAGATIWVAHPERLTRAYVCDYLVNAILSYYLRMTGRTCLHASAVQIDSPEGERAILFVADSGMGKSTLATYFARQGHVALSDDVSALTAQDDGIAVAPGYPYLRVTAQTTEALFGAVTALKKVAPDWHKRVVTLADRPPRPDQLIPISAVYIIADRAETLVFEPFTPRDAAIALMDYATLYYLFDPAVRARDFTMLSHLAAACPVYKLTTPADLTRLPDVYGAILEQHRVLSPG
ncbi:MAG: hypothetical protein SF162_10695 [bacterium]|nr:hypothetical protein [bacterium]